LPYLPESAVLQTLLLFSPYENQLNLFYLICACEPDGQGSLFDLQEVQFPGVAHAQNRDQHAQGITLRIDLVHFARKFANGPSMMRTDSFFSNVIFAGRRPFRMPWFDGTINLLILVPLSGTGVCPPPEAGDARSSFTRCRVRRSFHLHHDIPRIEQPPYW